MTLPETQINPEQLSQVLDPLTTDDVAAIDLTISRSSASSSRTRPYKNYRPDSSRVFYHQSGHFHGDYSAVDVSVKDQCVKVIWSGGWWVDLRGVDALRFLKLNHSKLASAFEPVRRASN